MQAIVQQYKDRLEVRGGVTVLYGPREAGKTLLKRFALRGRDDDMAWMQMRRGSMSAPQLVRRWPKHYDFKDKIVEGSLKDYTWNFEEIRHHVDEVFREGAAHVLLETTVDPIGANDAGWCIITLPPQPGV